MAERSLFLTLGNGPAECRAALAALIGIMQKVRTTGSPPAAA